MGCSMKKLDAISNGAMFFLKFYIFYWIVYTLVVLNISSLKECIALYSLWKLSVESTFKLKWKLSRLLLLQLAVLFIGFKFIADGLSLIDVSTFDRFRLIISNTVEKNRSVQNKLPVIKYYYDFLDVQMCYSDRTFDFESLLMVLDLLASLHFELLAY